MNIINDPTVKNEYWLGDYSHRIGMPAVEFKDGRKFWYFKSFCHKVNGVSHNKFPYYDLHGVGIDINIGRLVL